MTKKLTYRFQGTQEDVRIDTFFCDKEIESWIGMMDCKMKAHNQQANNGEVERVYTFTGSERVVRSVIQDCMVNNHPQLWHS